MTRLAFSSHACGAFEDWVYNLFRERDGLSKPGNARLYTLLCRIRSELRSRLRNILLHGFSFDEGENREREKPLLFNGCYFADINNRAISIVVGIWAETTNPDRWERLLSPS